MADTLTQEQIDAMLSSVLSGGDTASLDTHEEKEEIKEYDFRTPKKFTKEQIKILERIFENYSRHLSSYITGLLRLYCKVSLASIEEQKYFEFSNALPDYTIMGIVDLGIEDDDIEESNVDFTAVKLAYLYNDRPYARRQRNISGYRQRFYGNRDKRNA